VSPADAQLLETEELLMPDEVARIFRVDPKTVTRWATDGKLSFIRTLGGHRRYIAAEVRELINSRTVRAQPAAITPGQVEDWVGELTQGGTLQEPL
jgi:excisionase family DNA binding protein